MIPHTVSKLILSQPSYGVSPSGFNRVHVEMLPREVARLIGYDPRVLVTRPRKRETLPHNVSQAIVDLQNYVQRSIDKERVSQMVNYLVNAQERGAFADWGSIELVTASKPDMSDSATIKLDSDADYFIADGQHRFCALLDFAQAHPVWSERFTQGVTISILPEEKLAEWSGQEFHDRNYFSVPVRAGKALSVDTRDPLNALAKSLSSHPTIQQAGGIAYDRDSLLTVDQRFATHSTIHRFVRGFLFGRSGLDKGGNDTNIEITAGMTEGLTEYLTALGEIMPWASDTIDRDQYLTRTSAVLGALAVIGNDLYFHEPPLTRDEKVRRMVALSKIDWKRSNRDLIGVVGSEKKGLVQPASSRQAVDATIRFLRERLKIKP